MIHDGCARQQERSSVFRKMNNVATMLTNFCVVVFNVVSLIQHNIIPTIMWTVLLTAVATITSGRSRYGTKVIWAGTDQAVCSDNHMTAVSAFPKSNYIRLVGTGKSLTKQTTYSNRVQIFIPFHSLVE